MRVLSAHLLAVGLLLSFCPWSEAVSVYKYRLSDGTTLYSQTPGRHGVLLEVMHIPASSRADLNTQRQAKQALERDMARADYLTAIRQQQSAANACMSPVVIGATSDALPGERTGTVGRRSRLNDLYWQRVYGSFPGTEFVFDAPDPSRTEYERLK